MVLPPIKIGRKFVEDLDKLVEEGYYRSRSEAVRDAVKRLVLEMKRIMAIDEAVTGTREIRKELWDRALKAADGDRVRAMYLYGKG